MKLALDDFDKGEEEGITSAIWWEEVIDCRSGSLKSSETRTVETQD
jgi:hypothetical protein